MLYCSEAFVVDLDRVETCLLRSTEQRPNTWIVFVRTFLSSFFTNAVSSSSRPFSSRSFPISASCFPSNAWRFQRGHQRTAQHRTHTKVVEKRDTIRQQLLCPCSWVLAAALAVVVSIAIATNSPCRCCVISRDNLLGLCSAGQRGGRGLRHRVNTSSAPCNTCNLRRVCTLEHKARHGVVAMRKPQ